MRLLGRDAEREALGRLLTDALAGRSQVAVRELIAPGEVDKGNHFAARQEPELFTAELRAAFRTLR
jgi:hypothetical protein